MAGFGVSINPADLREIERAMKGIKNGYATVVSGAINKTLIGVKTDTKSEIRKDVTVKSSAIARTIKLARASKIRISGALKSTGGFVPLINYSARQTKKGVTVQITKGGPRKLWPGAFITTIGTHKGVFSRKKPPYKTRASNKLPWKRFGKKYRLPLEEQFGPRIPGIFAKDKVIEPVLKKAGDRIKKELNRRLIFEMSKYK